MTELSINRQKFKSSIKRGTGEAHLIMRANPHIDFSKNIITACLKNYAYDGQCEGSRALYLFELIQLSGRQDIIQAAILKGLSTNRDDTWSLVQLFELAKIFALQGNSEAREAIYNRFLQNEHQYDWAGYQEIIELDGLAGLKFIAEKFGKDLQNDPEDWQDDVIIEHFQKENLGINAWVELEKVAIDNEYISAYLANVKQTMARRKSIRKQDPVVYNNVIEEVLSGKRTFRFFRREMSDTELNMIARQLIIEKKAKHIEKLLSVFKKSKFPLDVAFLLDLAAKDPVRNRQIVILAVDALLFFKDDNVRQFALQHIKCSKKPEYFVEILAGNYKEGDGELLTELVNKTNNSNALEYMILQYVAIYKANKTKECQIPLEALYNKHTCGMCRYDIVQILIENNALSEKIKAEIRFDSNAETRLLATF